MTDAAGYMHPIYAHSLSEFGSPRELPHSGGWILERQIPGTSYKDAMGCYPLFACRDWSRLHEDLDDIASDLISLSLVADPFGEYNLLYLYDCLKDVVIPFKQHFVVDLFQPLRSFVCAHHSRYARKAFLQLHIEKCEDPNELLDDWIGLYTNLRKVHNITGIPAFSRAAFTKQFTVPGIVVFRAVHLESTVGMLLWYVQNEIGYYHLGAYSSTGYEMRASFALFWFAIEYFAAKGLRWINLGAGAGIRSKGADGLSRFKRGWATGTRVAYFCGRIFDPAKYSEIVKAKGISDTDYFPSYRKGEFA